MASSIRKRLIRLQLSLLIAAFIIIILLFNLFMQAYIRTSSANQLEELIHMSNEMVSHADERHDDHILPDLSSQNRGRLGTYGSVFVIGSDYTLLDLMQGEEETTRTIAADLEEKHADLNNLSNRHIQTETGNYYVSAITDYLRDEAFMVFFIDVSGILEFARTINLALIIIMLILIPVSYLIADRLSKSFANQAETLSSFAATLGKGDFSDRMKEEGDIEFSNLAKALNETADQLEAAKEQQTQFFQNVSWPFSADFRCFYHTISTEFISILPSIRINRIFGKQKVSTAGFTVSDIMHINISPFITRCYLTA